MEPPKNVEKFPVNAIIDFRNLSKTLNKIGLDPKGTRKGIENS